MNYLKIVLDGYCDPNEREHLETYFTRQQKMAKKEYFEAEEFYSGLYKAVESLNQIAIKHMQEQKSELFDILKYEKDKSITDEVKKQLNEILLEDFPVNLLHATNNTYRGNINSLELQYIKDKIGKSQQAEQGKETPLNNTSNNESTLQPQQSQQIKKQDETEQTEHIKHYISEEFTTIDNKGWKYIFRKEEDYNTFTDLLTNFFAHEKYILPREIKLQRKCKTKLAGALNDIYSEFCEGYSKLKTDEPFFKIVRVLNVFSKEDKDSLYKDITRYKSRSNH